jgi:hypothetical protein
MKTFAYILEKPSSVAQKFEDDFPYAFIPNNIDNIHNWDNGESFPAIVYPTKEDWVKNEGVQTYIEGVAAENIFEYTVKIL